MVLDYSKWDALELSDDSDIEVHPNVDKRSFIRAKQNQIHQQRSERRHHIETLKYERIINDTFLQRVDSLLAILRIHEADAGSRPDDFMMQALMEAAGDLAADEPPKPPEGVHSKSEQPRYSQMMASLVDQVKKEFEEAKSDGDWYQGYVKGIEKHRKKIIDLQKELSEKLTELETEEARKITSDKLHDGFNKSSVAKEKPKPAPKPKKTETVEVLNPGALNKNPRPDSAQSSGADADIDEPRPSIDEDEESLQPTELGKQFAKIKIGDYKACLQFIAEHHEVVEERETDSLLVEAFNAAMDGKHAYSKQCVHQALLLQYCRSLGRNGVDVFFKRITTPGHQAQKVFLDDVNSTYERIANRTAELATKPADPSAGATEQIQLHAVDPGTQININIPQPGSSDLVEVKAREIFDQFPPGLQRALESGKLDKVNEVLGKMSVEEAEEVVEKLGEGGMLSLERGVIDGTTEKGRERLAELEREAHEKGELVEEVEGEPVEEALNNDDNDDDEEHGGVQLKGKGKEKEKAVDEMEIADPAEKRD